MLYLFSLYTSKSTSETKRSMTFKAKPRRLAHPISLKRNTPTLLIFTPQNPTICQPIRCKAQSFLHSWKRNTPTLLIFTPQNPTKCQQIRCKAQSSHQFEKKHLHSFNFYSPKPNQMSPNTILSSLFCSQTYVTLCWIRIYFPYRLQLQCWVQIISFAFYPDLNSVK